MNLCDITTLKCQCTIVGWDNARIAANLNKKDKSNMSKDIFQKWVFGMTRHDNEACGQYESEINAVSGNVFDKEFSKK